MSTSLMMESSLSDGKFLQHPVDLYTSVEVTRSIPAGTSFGPCLLQNTFYETIAFIAQKSCDKRVKSYVFKVDPEAMKNSALVLSWMRLVQAARNKQEQNTEVFLKAGQLYVRTTRDIEPEEELLMWYDQELSHLLGFAVTAKRSHEDFKCDRCNQIFTNEYPFLAHCRFLCLQTKSDIWSRAFSEQKPEETKRHHKVTDFHNIARELEDKKSVNSEDSEISPRKRKHEETAHPNCRKTVLLEKTNISNDNTTHLEGFDQIGGDASSTESKKKPEKIQSNNVEGKTSLNQARDGSTSFTHGREMDRRMDAEEDFYAHSNSFSAFSLVLSNNNGEQKSAFCKPSKKVLPVDSQVHLTSAPIAPSSRIKEMRTAAMGYNNLMASNLLSTESLASPVAISNAFLYAPEQWSRNISSQFQSSPSSLTILPPTYTSFAVSVQNWCAKCNLSFRMTSDLVFHMRSHHKKEFAAESQMRRRREEKLTCPICHEYFRERHHLSRHMTSHN